MTTIDDTEVFQINVQAPVKRLKKWVVAYGSSLDTVAKRQYAVEHFDLVDTGFGVTDRVLEMKNPNNGYYTGNPDIKVIGYDEINGVWGPEYAPYKDPDWDYITQNEMWFLHYQTYDNQHRIHSCQYYVDYYMNPNPANVNPQGINFAQYKTAKIANYLNNVEPAYDGVFFDNAGRFPWYFGASGTVCYGPTTGVHATDSAQMYESLANYPQTGEVTTGTWVYSEIQAIMNGNPGKVIMGNSGFAFALTNNLGMMLCIEGFSDDNHWGSQSYQYQAMQDLNNGLTINSYPCAICRHTQNSSDIEAVRFRVLSALTSFLLVIKDPAKSYFCFQKTYSSIYPTGTASYWFDEIDTPLGDPTSNMALIMGNANEGVYRRDYEHAIILHNLSMGGQHTPNGGTTNCASNWQNTYDNNQSTSATMNANTTGGTSRLTWTTPFTLKSVLLYGAGWAASGNVITRIRGLDQNGNYITGSYSEWNGSWKPADGTNWENGWARLELFAPNSGISNCYGMEITTSTGSTAPTITEIRPMDSFGTNKTYTVTLTGQGAGTYTLLPEEGIIITI